MKNNRNIQGKFVLIHGMSFSSEYRSWVSMKRRCLNPDKKHEKYIGLLTYEKWITSFECFLNDMGKKPNDKYTIERIDNSLGYFPENCKWATRSEQNRNYSLNRVLEYNGMKLCVTEWAELLNIPRHRIYQRLNKGWSVEKSLLYGLKQMEKTTQ
jgi:hypothetical protein